MKSRLITKVLLTTLTSTNSYLPLLIAHGIDESWLRFFIVRLQNVSGYISVRYAGSRIADGRVMNDS
jgi:hypothetical protein